MKILTFCEYTQVNFILFFITFVQRNWKKHRRHKIIGTI